MESRRRADVRLFALKGWTVKSGNGKFFISPTTCFDNKHKWRGPYRSLQHATTAIARKLGEEFNKRNKRLEGVR